MNESVAVELKSKNQASRIKDKLLMLSYRNWIDRTRLKMRSAI